MNWKTRTMAASVMTAACLGLGGCGGKSFTALNMSVGPESAAVASRLENIKVDLVGVSDADAKEIESVSPAAWFAKSGTGADKRMKYASSTKHLEFRAGQGSLVAVPASDPIWRSWSEKKVTHVFVIGDPPPSATGDATSWIRDIAPLTRTWDNNEIKVWVDNAGLKLDRSPIIEK